MELIAKQQCWIYSTELMYTVCGLFTDSVSNNTFAAAFEQGTDPFYILQTCSVELQQILFWLNISSNKPNKRRLLDRDVNCLLGDVEIHKKKT